MRLLQKLAEDLQDRGKLDLSESFIDASFSGAKKGALVSALQTATDGLGRTVTSTTEDGSGTVKSIVSSNYDLIGRAYQTSNPYTGTPSYGTTQFDVLGRPISVTAPAPDASVTSFTYTNQYVTVTDPAGKQRKTQSDAAGRLASTFEPDINNSNQLTQQTSFTYTVLFLPRAIARNARSAA
jgi:YD repeat-containing protein